MIRYYTAGESHGKCLTVILEGIPAGLKINEEYINNELARRQEGYGRGKRMGIETDKADITAGIRWGETIGSPICLVVNNRDWDNNKKLMSADENDREESMYLTGLRPGHADLGGVLKYNRKDMRDILERSSARETAARVAAGAVVKKFLEELGINIVSFTKQIGEVKSKNVDMSVAEIINATMRQEMTVIQLEEYLRLLQKEFPRGLVLIHNGI
jgi:chorismate synthase